MLHDKAREERRKHIGKYSIQCVIHVKIFYVIDEISYMCSASAGGPIYMPTLERESIKMLSMQTFATHMCQLSHLIYANNLFNLYGLRKAL